MRANKIHKFVFISTPKACTHTIYKILKEHFTNGLSEGGFHSNQIPLAYQKYFRWTVVRNPYSRAVSLWWSACRLAHLDQYKFRARSGGQYDFTKFVVWLANTTKKERAHEPLMRNQSDWLTPVEPIHAIHLENLNEELKQLPFWKQDIEISQLNTTTQKIEDQEKFEKQTILRPPWEVMYSNQKAIESVLAWASKDFERFGYSKEIP